MNLSSIEKIDSLFKYLYDKGSEYTKYRDIVADHFKGDNKNNDIEGMLIKLEKDGYVDTGQHKIEHIRLGDETMTLRDLVKLLENRQEWVEQTTYKVSYEGRLLFEKSSQNKPYCELKRKDERRQIWIVTKTVAAVLNAIIIILIAAMAVYLQLKTYQTDQQQKETPSIIRKN